MVSITAGVQDDVYIRIAEGLPPELQRAIDDLLEVPSGAPRSALFHRKEYPPEASPAVILRYIERYHFLRDLGVSVIALRSLSLPMVRYFAAIAKRYDVYELRRFAPTKRYALTAGFLVEIHKTSLDHIVALHDQLLTKKMREAKNAFETRYRTLRRQYRRGRWGQAPRGDDCTSHRARRAVQPSGRGGSRGGPEARLRPRGGAG